jgi:hypothetical protein
VDVKNISNNPVEKVGECALAISSRRELANSRCSVGGASPLEFANPTLDVTIIRCELRAEPRDNTRITLGATRKRINRPTVLEDQRANFRAKRPIRAADTVRGATRKGSRDYRSGAVRVRKYDLTFSSFFFSYNSVAPIRKGSPSAVRTRPRSER